MDATAGKKQKIAILGGGVSSMTSALQLTNDPNWQDKYDITLYQMGWRLGGKGASGRNPEVANRIEEHGLHLWFGFYDNAFDLIQRVYKENNRPLHKPLAIWEEAFKPYTLVVLQEYVQGKWEHWPISFPKNDKTPGKPGPPPGLWQMMGMILDIAHDLHIQYFNTKNIEKPTLTGEHKGVLDKIKDFFGVHGHQPTEAAHKTFLDSLGGLLGNLEKDTEGVLEEVAARLIYTALQYVKSIEAHNPAHHSILLAMIEHLLGKLWGKMEFALDKDTDKRRLWIATDFALTTIKGILTDGVLTKGYDVINDIDFRDWLKKHGATAMTLDSALVEAVYIIVFGGYKYFSFEAGTALAGACRMALTYKGALYYRMQAGMGDTIFSPMYEVLKKRGVKFEFFHKVKNLKLNADGTGISEVAMEVQATLKNGGEYQPLFDVKGLPCWPSHPLYDQLTEGQALKDQGINLESYWSPWQAVGQKNLQAGIDFDILVQGISIGALPVIAKELINSNAKWKLMVDTVTACETQAFQLWMFPDLAGLGWPYWTGDMPMSGSYKEPFDTWADMSDLIIRESWPDEAFPNNIAYMCGPIIERVDYAKWDFNDHSVPATQLAKVKERTKVFLDTLSGHLWPNAVGPDGFNNDLLVDLQHGKGGERFDRQFFRANIDPTELYVLSETNSGKNRLKTDESGYQNMYITGDWIDVGFNAGCVEVSVMAGMQTARAILGQDFEIYGEKDNLY